MILPSGHNTGLLVVVEDLSAEKEGAKAPCMEESDDAGLMVDTMLLEVEKVQLFVSVQKLEGMNLMIIL